MPIVRVIKSQRFTTVPNTIPEHKDLSFKAKGLLLYLLSRPDGWAVHISQLARLTPHDGEKSVISGMQELVNAKLAFFDRPRNDKGRYITGGWTIYEEAVLDLPPDTDVSQNEPQPDFPPVDFPPVEKDGLLKTYSSKDGSEKIPPLLLREDPPPAALKVKPLKKRIKTFYPDDPEQRQRLQDDVLCKRLIDWVQHRGLVVDLDAQWEAFTRKAQANAYKYADWYCAFQNWLTSPLQNIQGMSTNSLPRQRAWEEHAAHHVRHFTNGPYCETCQRVLMTYEVPPRKEA